MKGQIFVRQLFPPESSKEQCLITLEPGYESLPDTPPSLNFNDPGYETLLKPDSNTVEKKPNSDYDPNYEVLQPLRLTVFNATLGDDGYAKVVEKKTPNQFVTEDEEDNIDGYSKVKDRSDDGYSKVKEPTEENVPGYSSISEISSGNNDISQINNKNHDYASISEALKPTKNNNNDNGEKSTTNLNNNDDETSNTDIYSTIVQKSQQPLNLSELKIII